jgi:uncharacterized repeat protein (TIGR01451 family)
LSARAVSLCGVAVEDTVTSICPVVTTPSLTVTRSCPPNPVEPGGVLVYGGVVRNTGDSTLTNITVLSSQPFPNTPVFVLASLAPGASAHFDSSFNAPLDACSVTSTLIASGRDSCNGAAVSGEETTTCPLVTAPRISVIKTCPPVALTPGATLVYSGTVTNTGNVTLNNVFVVNNQPVPNTPVFGPVTLAPGAGATFTGNYIVPAGVCAITGTVTATGRDQCVGTTVEDSFTATCLVVTSSLIEVTHFCPPNPVSPGALLTYSGSVRNIGNTVLTNIVVMNDRTGTTPVFTLASLAPGGSAGFIGSYTVPADSSCAIASTLLAIGNDATVACGGTPVSASATAVCPLLVAPALQVTELCPSAPVLPGGLLTYDGSVRNTGNVTLTNVVVLGNRSGATPIFTLAVLPPNTLAHFSGSYIVPSESACSVTSMLTATGNSQCGGIPVADTATVTCPLLASPGLTVTRTCPPDPVEPGGVLVYGGLVRNTGNVTLTNIKVVSSQPVPNTTVFLLASLAPGQSAGFNSSFNAPLDACSVISSLIVTGRDTCSSNLVSGSETTTCPLVSLPSLAVTRECPPLPVTPGGTLVYSGTVTNTGNVTLHNVLVLNDHPVPNTPVLGPITLAPGEGTAFTGGYLIPADLCAITDTVLATGRDPCTDNTIVTSTTTTCPVLTQSRITVTQVCPPSPAEPGGLLTYNGSVQNVGDTLLTNIVVLNSRSGATPVFTLASLAPGASAPFSGSFTVPANSGCSVSSTLSVTGNDATSDCGGIPVTAIASTICPLLTTPAIEVTQACPPTPGVPGGILAYTGTVRNAGNVTLTNIVVTNNRSGATPVFTLASMPPGTVAIFSGSYTVSPSGDATSTSTVRADSLCGGSVINSASSSCPVLTSSGIAVTKACPALPVTAGGTLFYTGTVTNSGNVTLTNVLVLDNQPVPNTPVLGPITLIPGEGRSFGGSYTVPLTACSTSDTLIAMGNNASTGIPATGTVSVNCPVTPTPASVVITQNCPAAPVSPGGLLTYTGTISNTGIVALNNIVVTNDHSGITPVFSAATLAPGAIVTFSGSYTAPPSGDSTSTSTVHADTSCGVSVLNSASSTCPILTSAGIAVTKACPALSVTAGGTLFFTGTVTNTGNVTLTNVVVVDNQPVLNTPVLGPITLIAGEGRSFGGSYTVPLTACSSSDTLTASGNNASTGIAVASTVSVNCPVLNPPSIAITQNCPLTPVIPGGLLTYSGSISNAGNVTLNNVTVFNNQPVPNTLVFGPVALAPGGSAVFTGSYSAPATGDATSTSTVRADSLCGLAVTNSASSTCPISTSSGIAVTKACPALPVTAGGTLSYSGTVTNTGNITLTNVLVLDNQPVPNTPVLGPITLIPGEGRSFSGSYIVPLNACSSSDTLTAMGDNANTGITVTGTVSVNCPVTTTPSITITENCPAAAVPAGSAFVFSGVVHNTGNVTLTNVFVRSDQPAPNTVVAGPLTLAANASTPYSGSYIVPAGPSTFSRTGTATFSTASPPSGPLPAGTLIDRFIIGTNFNGLMFADQDVNWGPTKFYAIRNAGTGTATFDSISTIAPNEGAIASLFNLTSTNYNALTLAAPDVGFGAVNFYYIRNNSAGVSTFGVIKPAGASSDADLKVVGTNFNALTFSATDVGYGANLFYYLRTDAGGLSTFGTIVPALLAATTDRFPVGTNFDALVFSSTDMGYGANLFYYLRHDASGLSTFGTINPVTHAVIDRFAVGRNAFALAFSTTDAGYGVNNFYFLHAAVVPSSNPVINTVTASGMDTCLARTVSATATCSGILLQSVSPSVDPNSGASGRTSLQSVDGSTSVETQDVQANLFKVAPTKPSDLPVITSIKVAQGRITVSWSATPGVAYCLQYRTSFQDPTWKDIDGYVVATGKTASKEQAIGTASQRIYRVRCVPE